MPREDKKGLFGTKIKGSWAFIAILVAGGMWIWSGYNGLVSLEEPIATAWGNVETTYQSRADKVKNLVATVKGAAKYENETLIAIVEKRAEAVKGITINMDEMTPEKMAEFEKMQSQFSGSLSKLLAVFENYPDLKAVDAYRDFQHQYEGIENRILKARGDYNETIRPFNTKLKKFPMNMVNKMFGFETHEYFKANEGTEDAPDIDFDL